MQDRPCCYTYASLVQALMRRLGVTTIEFSVEDLIAPTRSVDVAASEEKQTVTVTLLERPPSEARH